MSTRFELPQNLPIPTDDGACDHLTGVCIPSISLSATDGTNVNLGKLPGTTVVYCYPRTGDPNLPVPEGWDNTPGARGCTPQSCSFRDHFQELKKSGVHHLFGFSTQDTNHQTELAVRHHLPFPILSDAEFKFVAALNLPTFEFGSFGKLVKRLTLVIRDGRIVKVFYPVFPPDQNVSSVIQWLNEEKL